MFGVHHACSRREGRNVQLHEERIISVSTTRQTLNLC